MKKYAHTKVRFKEILPESRPGPFRLFSDSPIVVFLCIYIGFRASLVHFFCLIISVSQEKYLYNFG